MTWFLRYQVSNQHENLDTYALHLSIIFYPFRNKEDLKAGESKSYYAKLQESGVINIINDNRILVEAFGDLVDEAFLFFESWVPFILQKNDDVNSELLQGKDNGAQQSDVIKILMYHILYLAIQQCQHKFIKC